VIWVLVPAPWSGSSIRGLGPVRTGTDDPARRSQDRVLPEAPMAGLVLSAGWGRIFV
jgi:hypothetical protein